MLQRRFQLPRVYFRIAPHRKASLVIDIDDSTIRAAYYRHEAFIGVSAIFCDGYTA